MSAIFGILGEADHDEIGLMGERLAHRGAFASIWSPTDRLHFGRRDADAGDHGSGTGDGLVNFCGFVDNRTEVAAQLGRPADAAVPDGSLAYEVYRRWGAEGFGRLSGQFAVAIWDAQMRKLILARDAWSSCPLFVTETAGRFAFATEYKALLCLESARPEPNRNAIQFIHCTKYAPPDASCLLNIDPVPAGGWLELSDGVLKRHQYMSLDLEILDRSDEAHANDLKASLLQAVQRQGQPYETLGVSLSGGVDSALLVGAVKRVFPQRELHTFTAGFSSDDGDVGEAAEVARHFGTNHHEVFLAATDLPSLMPTTLWHMEDPIGREEKLFYYITAREAQKSVPLLLAGHNADGLFGGMPRHRVVKAASATPFASGALEEFYDYTQTGNPARSALGKLLVRLYFRGKVSGPPKIIGADSSPVGSGFQLDAAQPLSALLRDAMLADPNANSAIERIHAACGLHFNSPFLDTDLVRCAFRIPDRLKIKACRQKYILRRAGEGLLPESMLKRKKGLLRLQHDTVLCEVIESLAHDMLSPAAVNSRGLFEGGYVERIRRRPQDGIYPTDQLYRLWSLLMTEFWARLFIDGRGAPPAAAGAGTTIPR